MSLLGGGQSHLEFYKWLIISFLSPQEALHVSHHLYCPNLLEDLRPQAWGAERPGLHPYSDTYGCVSSGKLPQLSESVSSAIKMGIIII